MSSSDATLWKDGHQVFEAVFSPEEVAELRRDAAAAVDHRGDLLSHPALSRVVLDPRVVAIARELLGGEPVYFGDSLVARTRKPGTWHKDNPSKLDGSAPDWDGRYPLLRFGLYLQDHSRHSGGIGFRRRSHEFPNHREGRQVYVGTRVGDLVAWNLRTTHRGHASLLRGTRIPLGRRLDRVLPEVVKAPTGGDRLALFMTYAAEGAHLDRFIRYLTTRTYALERWRHSTWAEDAHRAASRNGLRLRDTRRVMEDSDPQQATDLHRELPIEPGDRGRRSTASPPTRRL